MSNSSLVSHTNISPNKTVNRTHTIDTITPHCVVGQTTVEQLGKLFANPARKASSNYGIGYDGKIGMYVEEKDRSWCSSNAANDHRAVTIEIASDTTHPYAITDAAYKSTILLCADICRRNGIASLKWKADKSLIGKPEQQNVTVHRWFDDKKSCPGDYIYTRLGQMVNEVNALLSSGTAVTTTSSIYPDAPFTVEVLNKVDYRSSPAMTGPIVGTASKGVYTITAVTEGWGQLKSGAGWVWLGNGDQVKIQNGSSSSLNEFLIEVTVTNLNIRTGPGTNYSKTGSYVAPGFYTITDTKSGVGSVLGWGKLKSGAGWVSLDYANRI